MRYNGRGSFHDRIIAIAIVVTSVVATCAAGATTAPEPKVARELLEQVRIDMLEALKDPAVRQDKYRVREIVDSILVPHVELDLASRLILTEHWKNASEAQRSEFVGEFRHFLVRFYSAALASYSQDNADMPDRLMRFSDDIQKKGDRQVVVRSTVNQPVGQPIPVDYRFVLADDRWKVIDVSISGISMIKNYRSSFARKVEAEGFQGLVEYLKARNRELE